MPGVEGSLQSLEVGNHQGSAADRDRYRGESRRDSFGKWNGTGGVVDFQCSRLAAHSKGKVIVRLAAWKRIEHTQAVERRSVSTRRQTLE